MVLMLPPAPMKRAAEARATNAIKRVYSIRSCPCSSFQKLRTNVIVFAPKFFSVRLCVIPEITGLSFRDLAITAFSGSESSNGTGCAHGHRAGPEYQRDAVIKFRSPTAGFLQHAGKRRVHGQQNRVDSKTSQDLLPVVFHVEDVNISLFKLVAVEIATAVYKHFVRRIEAPDEVVAPFIVGEDSGGGIVPEGGERP